MTSADPAADVSLALGRNWTVARVSGAEGSSCGLEARAVGRLRLPGGPEAPALPTKQAPAEIKTLSEVANGDPSLTSGCKENDQEQREQNAGTDKCPSTLRREERLSRLLVNAETVGYRHRPGGVGLRQLAAQIKRVAAEFPDSRSR